MSAYSYIEAIKNRMSREDVRFYRDIFAPTEVATPDSDAWDQLCVMPDGEIRVYGVYHKKSVLTKRHSVAIFPPSMAVFPGSGIW